MYIFVTEGYGKQVLLILKIKNIIIKVYSGLVGKEPISQV